MIKLYRMRRNGASSVLIKSLDLIRREQGTVIREQLSAISYQGMGNC